MSGYGSYVAYGGGRSGGSPYTSNIVDPYARNLSGHFEYIDADHGMLQDGPRASATRGHNSMEDPDAPDVILVRYMASIIPVEFPPYSISEEKAYVAQLREAVAKALQTDSRRIQLIYKKRDLKHDSWPLRRYNMKQNSEVAAIKRESFIDYSDRDSHSSSGEESGSNTYQNPRRRPRALSSVRHRSDENLPQQSSRTAASSSSFLHPNGHTPSGPPSKRPSRSNLKPEADERSYRREPSRSRGPSPHPSPSPTPVPQSIPAADPSTPMGKLQTLSNTFRDQWLPLCHKFMSNPPSDPQTRAKEHRKLSESVMTHILLKADAIDVDSAETRAFRKALINDANETMKKIDVVARG